MFDKLESTEHQYEELLHRLGTAELQSDPTEYRKQSKTLSDIEPTVQRYREYKTVMTDIGQTEELAKAGDPDMRELAQEELKGLLERREALVAELKILLIPKDPNDEKNVVLEIRAGTGGDEAALFAGELFRMYAKYAERQGWRLEMMSTSESGVGGMKEGIATIEGRGVYSKLKYESGVHRVQRVPATEASGRIHTSTATVAVLPEAEDVDVQIEDKDLEFSIAASGGPGGQGVNTTNSAVQILHKPSGIIVKCQDERSQLKNKAKALKVLKSRLLDIEREKKEAEEASARRSMVSTGERSQKIRTYNYPQNRVSDHRIKLTLNKLDRIIGGDIEELITALRTHRQAELLHAAGMGAAPSVHGDGGDD